MTMKVEYLGAAGDASGYGEAARNYLHALSQQGVKIMLRPLSFEQHRPDLGPDAEFLEGLLKDDREPAHARIVHLTPDVYERTLTGLPPLPTIGYAAWETDRVPPGWVDPINRFCQALWVPSIHNVGAFKNSGVTVPIYRVPHTFPPVTQSTSKPVIARDGVFRFLSVFQWTERKNPSGLLRAYLTTFRREDNVSLVLKTYVKDSTAEEKEQIKAAITEVKRTLYLPSYPRIELIVSVLPKDRLLQLYQDCDCYVSLHRCEGFGIPIAEAMLAGKPVIATRCGGPTDVWAEGMRGINWMGTPVFGMPWNTYTGDMMWAEPDLEGARYWMREYFLDRGHAERDGANGQKHAINHLAYPVVGRQMVALLEEMLAK